MIFSIALRVADPQVMGFETKVAARRNVFYPLVLEDGAGKRLLSVEDQNGARMDAVFTTAWGGMAVSPYVLAEGYEHSYRWVLNPFAFFKKALQLADVPVPDVTTLDGHRMLIVHIDGDGFPSRAEMPGNDYCGKVILDQILSRYRVKSTVSIIEGEIGAAGKWPKLSPELEPIARAIFALPNVEVASHTYSHPFDLLRLGQDQEDGEHHGQAERNRDRRPHDDAGEYRERGHADTSVTNRSRTGMGHLIGRGPAPSLGETSPL